MGLVFFYTFGGGGGTMSYASNFYSLWGYKNLSNFDTTPPVFLWSEVANFHHDVCWNSLKKKLILVIFNKTKLNIRDEKMQSKKCKAVFQEFRRIKNRLLQILVKQVYFTIHSKLPANYLQIMSLINIQNMSSLFC